MTPTPEQLEAVRSAIEAASAAAADGDPEWGNWTTDARAAWDVIAPLVLETAAQVAEEPTEQRYPLDVRRVVAARIRALK